MALVCYGMSWAARDALLAIWRTAASLPAVMAVAAPRSTRLMTPRSAFASLALSLLLGSTSANGPMCGDEEGTVLSSFQGAENLCDVYGVDGNLGRQGSTTITECGKSCADHADCLFYSWWGPSDAADTQTARRSARPATTATHGATSSSPSSSARRCRRRCRHHRRRPSIPQRPTRSAAWSASATATVSAARGRRAPDDERQGLPGRPPILTTTSTTKTGE